MKNKILIFFFCSFILNAHSLFYAHATTKTIEAQNQKAEKSTDKQNGTQEESIPVISYLDPQLDSTTLKNIQLTTKSQEKRLVTLWIGNVERLNDPLSFVKALPPHIGILVDAFAPLPQEVLNVIGTQGRQWAMVMPTRTRFDGENNSPETLNTTVESRAFFENILKQSKNMSVFIPNMIDIDQEVLEYIITLSEQHNLTLIVPPQFFNTIQTLCKKKSVDYQLLDVFSPIDATFDDFKSILEESLEILDTFGKLNAAIFIPDEHKKNYINTYLKSIAEKKGHFINVQTMIKTK